MNSINELITELTETNFSLYDGEIADVGMTSQLFQDIVGAIEDLQSQNQRLLIELAEAIEQKNDAYRSIVRYCVVDLIAKITTDAIRQREERKEQSGD